jgi:Ni,Fe-hydrogenase III large subunit
MMSGARAGRATWLRLLLARSQARDLTAFVVPGLEVARMRGLDLDAAGLRVVATPRHASVLLLVGELPEGLRGAAAVAYAQMARPRAILAAGTDDASPLPEPDVAVAADQEAVVAGATNLRRFVATGAWSPDAPAFDVPEVQPTENDAGTGMDHDGHGHGHGHDGMDMPRRHDQDTGHGDRGARTDATGPGDRDMDEGGDDHGARMGDARRVVVRAGSDTVEIGGDRTDRQAHGTGTDGATGHDGGSGCEDQARQTHEGGQDHGDQGEMHGQMGGAQGHDAGHDAGGQDTRPDHGDMYEQQAHHDGERRQHVDHGDDGHGDDHEGAMHMRHGGHGNMDGDMGGLDHGDMGGMDHGDMSDMDMGGGGMSMIMMTKDLPRSPDGLPMEWVEAPFGPLFSGLPGGLALTFTLDGDAVAKTTVAAGTVGRGLTATWPGSAAMLPARLARLDPLAPVAYRLLATRALEDAAGSVVDGATARARVGALERERAASHLGWVALFGELLGDRWMAARAEALQLALLRAGDIAAVESVRAAVGEFARRAQRTPYLRRRLAGIGLPHAGGDGGPKTGAEANDETARVTVGALPRGPVARAAGLLDDVRADDPTYQGLSFIPVVRAGNDAWARLRVRLAEIEQSLGLTLAAGAVAVPDRFVATGAGGVGAATVETPRGAATLRVTVEGGVVRDVTLDTPSTHNATLIKEVSDGREVADALVGVASLDLSPWEMDR